LSVCWKGSSEPQTLSIHTTGSEVACRAVVPASLEVALTGEPVVLMEQLVRASATTTVRSVVRTQRLPDGLPRQAGRRNVRVLGREVIASTRKVSRCRSRLGRRG
jgi:hypothetical protein